MRPVVEYLRGRHLLNFCPFASDKPHVGNVYTERRVERLLATQNPDGGWGYTARKQSWLEPTAYALLALNRTEGAGSARDRAWQLVSSWQRPDGGWKANALVEDAHWTTALVVTLHAVRGQFDGNFQRGVEWLLGTSGVENGVRMRLGHWLKPDATQEDFNLVGWPWRPGTTSWVEPTVHALIALRKAAAHYSAGKLMSRVTMAQKMLLDRRCVDGGWNYGNRRVLQTDLNSYPETTALGLLGLQSSGIDVQPSIRRAREYFAVSNSAMAQAWLSIALRNFGQEVPANPVDQPLPNDLQVVALQLLSAPRGGHELLLPA